ncbi:MAG: 30S ribosomal protein S8e [Candidatus Micrarchaeota archaeon]
MQQYHESNSRKKVSSGTGGMRRKNRDKKLSHVGGVPTLTKVATKSVIDQLRTRGGSDKAKLKRAAFANVRDKTGKIVKTKILSVAHSAIQDYIRANIITKGCVLNTELGEVIVTNRVGQDAVVNGVLKTK